MRLDDPRIQQSDGKYRGRPVADLTGERFNMLTVVRCVGFVKGRSAWLCKCDCGNETVLLGRHLRNRRSCGCLATNNTINRRTPAKVIYDQYAIGARVRGIPWNLSVNQVAKMIQAPCHYCGKMFSNYKKEFNIRYNGIDRKDPSKGYDQENTIPCCSRCNYLKHGRTYDEFVEHLRDISMHLFGK
jgi:hypothetical protein